MTTYRATFTSVPGETRTFEGADRARVTDMALDYVSDAVRARMARALAGYGWFLRNQLAEDRDSSSSSEMQYSIYVEVL